MRAKHSLPRSAFSVPRERTHRHPHNPLTMPDGTVIDTQPILYHLFDVVVNGHHVGQMQWHPHRHKWKCVRFSNGEQSYQRNRTIAINWIKGELK